MFRLQSNNKEKYIDINKKQANKYIIQQINKE